MNPSTTSRSERPDLDGYDPVHPEQKKALTAARRLLATQAAVRAPTGISFLGASGSGKTHLAKAICKEFARRGVDTMWTECCAIVDEARNGDMERFEFACDAEFLALDDLGTETRSEFATQLVNRLIEKRINRWTVVTSNLLLRQIQSQLDVRIASRLQRLGPIIELPTCPDYTTANKVWQREGRPLTKEQKLALREKELAPHHVSRLPEEKLEEMRKRLQSLANHLTTY